MTKLEDLLVKYEGAYKAHAELEAETKKAKDLLTSLADLLLAEMGDMKTVRSGSGFGVTRVEQTYAAAVKGREADLVAALRRLGLGVVVQEKVLSGRLREAYVEAKTNGTEFPEELVELGTRVSLRKAS